MSDQVSHKPVDHLAAAGDAARSLASNLWHAGGDGVHAVGTKFDNACHNAQVTLATVTEKGITFAGNCAHATTQAVAHGVDSGVQTVKAVARENDITPMAKAIAQAPAAAARAYEQRQADFKHDRPTTAKLESALPPLEITHALLAGGKKHASTSEQSRPVNDTTGGGAGGSGSSGKATAHDRNDDAPPDSSGASGATDVSGVSGDSHGGGHGGRSVSRGETYWSIARDEVGKNASNKDVVAEVNKLMQLNHHKKLQENGSVQIY